MFQISEGPRTGAINAGKLEACECLGGGVGWPAADVGLRSLIGGTIGLISPAPRGVTFFAGQPMLRSMPSKPSWQRAIAVWPKESSVCP